MKIYFRFFLSHVKLAQTCENSSILPNFTAKTRQCRDVTYDVIDKLRRLGLSKCVPALCHKLIYEIAIFHSINGETCDKYIYDIYRYTSNFNEDHI